MKTKFLSLILCSLLLFSSACSNVAQTGRLHTESRTVEVGGAETVNATLTISAGTLHVSGGAADLLAADFTYNVDAWQPEVSYQVNNGQGVLKVRQPHNDDVVVNVKGGVGALTVALPSQVNVHAEVHGGLGELVTTGLQKDGNALVHKASASDVRLTLDIEGGLGQVDLEVQE